MNQTLFIGIGNSARQDDGLGWAFVEQIEECFPEVDVQYKFQLNIEDAELISKYDKVYFVDAFRGNLTSGFFCQICQPLPSAEFSTHLLSPASVLYLCQELYQKIPQAWVIGIKGYTWELEEGLSPDASLNLSIAGDWLKDEFYS